MSTRVHTLIGCSLFAMLFLSCSPQGDVSASATAPVRVSFELTRPDDDVSGFTVLGRQDMATDELTSLRSLLILDVTSASESTPATQLLLTSDQACVVNPSLDLDAREYTLYFIASTYDLGYDPQTGLVDVLDPEFSTDAEPVSVYATKVVFDLSDGLSQNVKVTLGSICATVQITVSDMFSSSAAVLTCTYAGPKSLRPLPTGLQSEGACTRASYRNVAWYTYGANTELNKNPKAITYTLLCPESCTRDLTWKLYKKDGTKEYRTSEPASGQAQHNASSVPLRPSVKTVISAFSLYTK